MANDKNIHTFNAADIEKYHKGLLSGNERHALEKAALDDPFLADALEGYNLPGLNAATDIAMLKSQLAARVEKDQAKVVPLGGGKQSSFPWLRAAVAVLVIGGTGLLASQYIFNTKKQDNIAQAEKTANAPVSGTDTATPAAGKAAGANEANGNTSGSGTVPPGTLQDTKPVNNKPENLNNTTSPVTDVNPGTETEKISTPNREIATKPVTTSSETVSLPELKKSRTAPAPTVVTDKATVVDDKATGGQINPGIAASERAKEKVVTEADGVKDQAIANSRKTEEQKYRSQHNNIFRGRVTDAKNAGVPFANVTNIEDKAGTYTDVNGYFNFTSPDTVLNVQVRSIGFENNQVQLKNSVANTKVVLQEDRSLSEVILSNQKPNVAARNRDANRVLHEPEPADGWDNYDAYIANNLDIPEDIKTKQNQTGSVQVSFEVDKYGEPINIRVEKSLCDKCDKEAIRLIKDGPKWKRSASRNGRTTVTINF
jgi:CarboxypepD_reg-like domain/Gram-negative bacterial TonB protein C-terminal